MKQTSEIAFETVIELVLLVSGFERHQSPDFDREQVIFPISHS
ncbi:hypothetical protein [Nodosilinea sp. LEGE 07088]|nr:hypothetical protein [Nodosilinea sp. LEGE 07088]